jgi:hypothetical protein
MNVWPVREKDQGVTVVGEINIGSHVIRRAEDGLTTIYINPEATQLPECIGATKNLAGYLVLTDDILEAAALLRAKAS